MSSSKLSNDSVTATSNFSIITQDGSGATKGGDISILPGDGGPTDGVGGDVTITAGSGAGTGKNGDVIITAPIVGGGADGIISLSQNGATSTWPDMSTLPAVGDFMKVSNVVGSTVTLSYVPPIFASMTRTNRSAASDQSITTSNTNIDFKTQELDSEVNVAGNISYGGTTFTLASNATYLISYGINIFFASSSVSNNSSADISCINGLGNKIGGLGIRVYANENEAFPSGDESAIPTCTFVYNTAASNTIAIRSNSANNGAAVKNNSFITIIRLN